MVVADSATAQRRWSAVLNVCYAVNCDVGCWMLLMTAVIRVNNANVFGAGTTDKLGLGTSRRQCVPPQITGA
jgi:hypothetical protein